MKTIHWRRASNPAMKKVSLEPGLTAVAALACLLFIVPNLAAAALPAPEVPAGASGKSALQDEDSHVVATLLIESEAVQTDETFRVGVMFEIPPDWHLYWRNPGDSGLPTRVDWKVENATVGPLQWPAPEVFHELETGYLTFGYAEQTLLASEMSIHTQVDGPVEIGAEIDFLACKEICIPGHFELSRVVTLGGTSAPIARATEIFDLYDARVPRKVDASELGIETWMSQDAVRPGDSFVFAVGAPTCATAERCDLEALRARDLASIFIPYAHENPALRPLGLQDFPTSERGFLLAMRGHVAREAPARNEEPIRGILALPDAGYVEIALPFPMAEHDAPITRIETDWLDPAILSTSDSGRIALGYALLLALCGGLILNLMPCVLPVLAIKVVSLSQLAHEPRRHVAAHGLVYGAGIQASMAILAATVLALRQAGTAVGWGFQFREPLFLAAIALLVVVFACNLFGWFDIRLNTSRIDEIGRQASGLRRSFFDGFLAVALATPCSAPFLGTAVGFAFAGGPLDIVLIFSGIGFGLALPFVATALVPGMSRVIPKPGPWMVRLRVALGFALLGTGAWLLWILGRTAGTPAQLAVSLLLVIAAGGTYAVGRLQRLQSQRTFALGTGVAVVVLGALVALPLEPIHADLEADAESSIAWKTFDPDAIRAELRDERPVFVYFTADWCITCKVNERIVLEDTAVTDALRVLDVATFRGDWTLRDEAIRLELARHGKAGVPVYLVYAPDRPERPYVLPELITVDNLVKALERAARRRAI